MTHCAICGNDQGPLEEHHIQHRSTHPDLQDDPDNILAICSRCHRSLHDGLLKVEGHRKRFQAWRKGEGGEWQEFSPWAMLKAPAEVSGFLNALQREPQSIHDIIAELRTWNDEALAALDEIAKEREAEMSELRCSVIGILVERYRSLGMPLGEAKVEAAKRVGESLDMADKLLGVWQRFVSQGISLRRYPALSLTNFIVASEYSQPVKALEYVEELKERGLPVTTRRQRALQRAGLPNPDKAVKGKELKSCYRCVHLAKAPDGALLTLTVGGREVATGDGAGKHYCHQRERLLETLGAPIEVAEACDSFAWKEG